MRITPPRDNEPIRLINTKSGHRYRAVLTVSPKGAPRRQTTATFPTLEKAREWVDETRDRVRKGDYTTPSRVTVATLGKDWLASKRDVRAVTREGYQTALNNIDDVLGDRRAQSISRKDCEDFVTRLDTVGGRGGRPLSQRSQVLAVQVLRQVLGYGVSCGVLRVNPAADVKARRRTKDDHHAVNVWTPAQLHTFVKTTDASRDVWVRVGFRLTACGLRRSEVLGLAWEAVDLDAGAVRVEASRVRIGRYQTARDETKSRASTRVVPVETIWPGTVAMLRALRAVQAAQRLAAGSAYGDTGLVITDALGAGVHPEVYAQRWRALRRGLPVIRLHEVRHSLARVLHEAGMPPADAAALLGHSLAVHLAHYVPSTERGAAAAAVRLGEVLAAVQ